MERRKFIQLGALAAVCSATSGVFSSCTGNKQIPPALQIPPTLGKFCTEQELTEIGKAYLNHFPSESDADKLQVFILGTEASSLKDKDQLSQHLQEQAKTDFTEGKSVVVKGWVLSQTEGRQCALLSLTNSPS